MMWTIGPNAALAGSKEVFGSLPAIRNLAHYSRGCTENFDVRTFESNHIEIIRRYAGAALTAADPVNLQLPPGLFHAEPCEEGHKKKWAVEVHPAARFTLTAQPADPAHFRDVMAGDLSPELPTS